VTWRPLSRDTSTLPRYNIISHYGSYHPPVTPSKSPSCSSEAWPYGPVDTGQDQVEFEGCGEDFSMPHTVNVVTYFLERRAFRLYFCIKLGTVMIKHSCVTK
jgi:hypothetical protein